MDVSDPVRDDTQSIETFARTLRDQRTRARSFLEEHRRENENWVARFMTELEKTLASAVEERQELESARSSIDERESDLNERLEQFREESERLTALRDDLQTARASWIETLDGAALPDGDAIESQCDRMASLIESLTKRQSEWGKQNESLLNDLSRHAESLGESSPLEAVREQLQALTDGGDTSKALREALDEHAERMEALREQIESQRALLEEHRDELAKQQTAIDSAREALEEQRNILAEERATFEKERARIESESTDLESGREQIESLRQSWESQLETLGERLEEVAARESETKAQRRRIAETLRAQREKQIREIERRRAELQSRESGEVDQLELQLRGVEQQRDRMEEELANVREKLDEQLHRLEPLEREKAELAAATDEAIAARETLEKQLAAAKERHSALHAEATEAKQSLEEATTERDAIRARHAELAAELENLRAREAELSCESKESTRRIESLEQALSDLREQQAVVESGASDSQRQLGEMQARIQEAEHECERLREELSSAREATPDENVEAELDDLRADRERLNQLLAESEREVEQLRSAQGEGVGGVAPEEVEERDERIRRLEAEVEELRSAPSGGGGDDDEFRRRYEMAMDDLRELKLENEKLKEDLANAPAGAAAPVDHGALDWETQKRLLIAELEGEAMDGEEMTEGRKKERLKIEEIIERTDALVARKQEELDELSHMLEHQAGNIGAVAVGAAALGEVFDQDELIQQERENLKQLQEQWQEKLRQAEVELSVERAKMARDKAEIEEKLRMIENHAANSPTDGDKGGKSIGGRWLAKLGLRDNDES